ncbi:MAG TPA: ABC transporter substrate-binding protein [Myxococcales bacterium LLY-WYZ-16_1]|nr:ABC transporter substrate-binding protein [Myxococcales bacterium LLY-WYZ-16_1]
MIVSPSPTASMRRFLLLCLPISTLSFQIARAFDGTQLEQHAHRWVRALRTVAKIEAPARREQRARRLLGQAVALSRFADLALVDVSHALTSPQRTALATALEDLIEARIIERIDAELSRSCLGHRLKAEGMDFEARVWLTCPDLDSTVELHLARASRGASWRVVDAAFDGVLLSRQYRAMINKQLRQRGIAGLHRRLRQLGRKTSTEEGDAE